MLILTRQKGGKIHIGNDIKITFVRYDLQFGCAHIGITAPPDLKIYREEIADRIKREKQLEDLEQSWKATLESQQEN